MLGGELAKPAACDRIDFGQLAEARTTCWRFHGKHFINRFANVKNGAHAWRAVAVHLV